ncbi:MAG TPA: BglII/BstYI family type II restriction endonuclease [Pyrinomonadaceae bacterium]|nr:BglII/BstYI family type II restriction endonuclease [Pyrinomonadaceae bacterium]
MRLAALYSFKNGLDEITKRYSHLLAEIKAAIAAVDASKARTKLSREKTKVGRMLYSPVAFNKAFQKELYPKGWNNLSIDCEYPTTHYLEDYEIRSSLKGAFRDMDFVKDRLGVEVQFGKYSFMVYNVCAKMTIFRNLNFIDYGIEIVPVKALALEMSSGVSYFEQFVWDLESRGVADIDFPVLILGIDV